MLKENNLKLLFFKKINVNLKNKINKHLINKLKIIKYLSEINDKIMILNIYTKKKKLILYDVKQFFNYFYVDIIIDYHFEYYIEDIFQSLGQKNDVNIYKYCRRFKNYVKFQYLLCIISIMRQKYNFQDYGFCNYFISFL